MSAFLFLLFKLNLVMGATIILVWLLRRPLRLLFGATIAYAIWILLPVTSIACLFPPRVAAPALAHIASAVSAAPVSVHGPITRSVLRVAEQLTKQSVPMPPTVAAPALASAHGTSGYALMIFGAWALGVLLTAFYLIQLQLRFHAAVRRGEAGPAVLGFLRPRIVMPDGFQEHFTPQEQAAILRHERVHVARQDARVNALAAFLRCLCWFNPLIHLGATWMRVDQELACDATAVAGAISRRDYAKALLKSQMVVTALPLGCNWPGSQHPLIERVALLKRKTPGTARRLAGAGLVVLVATFAGVAAWAAQPPVAARFVAPAHQNSRVALAVPPAMNPEPDQNPGTSGTNELVADANPIASGHRVDDLKDVPAVKPISAAPPLSQVAPQPSPQDAAAPATEVASNVPSGAPTQPASETSPASPVDDQPAGPTQTMPHDAPAGPVLAALGTPVATPAKASSDKSPIVTFVCKTIFVTGRVVSPNQILMQAPTCGGDQTLVWCHANNMIAPLGGLSTTRNTGILCKFYIPMNVLNFADAADAGKMQRGKIVELKGDFHYIKKGDNAYFYVAKATVPWVDPWGR